MREREIKKYLVKRVKALGGEVRKVRWEGRNGAPDQIVMLRRWETTLEVSRIGSKAETLTATDLTIWVELKATGKEAEPHQLREHKRMRDMGQRVEVVDSFEAVDRILK